MKTLCEHIMVKTPITLQPDCTFNQELAIAQEHNVRYLPVVDENGRFLGIFSTLTLLNLLLPQAVSINMGKKLVDLNFMRTSIEELRAKLDDIGHQTIDKHLTTNVPICHADSSIMEAIHILHDHHAHVVVTDKASGRFEGIITIKVLVNHLTQV